MIVALRWHPRLVAGAALVALACGCNKRTSIAAEDLPDVLRRREARRGDLAVKRVDGRPAVVGDVHTIEVQAIHGHVFMTPPVARATSAAVPWAERRRRKAERWLATETEVATPARAELENGALRVTPLHPCWVSATSSACEEVRSSGWAPQRAGAYPARQVAAVGLHEAHPADTAVLTVGIVVGSLAAVAASVALVLSSYPAFH